MNLRTLELFGFKSFMRKLDIHNRAGLVKYAIRKKLVHVSAIEGGS